MRDAYSYKDLYHLLLNGITDAIRHLQTLQQKSEEIYLSNFSEPEMLEILPKDDEKR